MNTLAVAGRKIDTDDEGYLVDLGDWSEDVAERIAEADRITLTDRHWEIVRFLRKYYEDYRIAPAIRVMTKAVAKSLGPEKGSREYLDGLFPNGAAKQGCKIAGLPKPTGCA